MRSTPKQLAVDAAGFYTLVDVNGFPLLCAYRNPFLNIEEQEQKIKPIAGDPAPAKKTTMVPNYCNSQCPHFHCDGGKKTFITCSGITVEHPIAKILTE